MDDDGIEIVVITPQNASILDVVADGVFDEPVQPELVEGFLASGLNLLVVGVDATVEPPTVVAQCSGVIHHRPDRPTELYLSELGTALSHRRRGIARRLVTAMLDLGRDHGCRGAWLVTEPENEPARRLYEGMGNVELAVIYEFER